jgi:hypothetical protein
MNQDNYLLAGKQLVVKQLPLAQVHPHMFKGANQKFHIYPTRQQHADKVNKVSNVASFLLFIFFFFFMVFVNLFFTTTTKTQQITLKTGEDGRWQAPTH